ncbi:unnamed protein product [Moneuplotes crassus]|uniref:Uncharacterized protein n=1 Tax=Euplotes crassus TaxID=5936 RepID=A0AAD1X870_EUPCR|nr:unnamed protein product [Moneuplotes crassus]
MESEDQITQEKLDQRISLEKSILVKNIKQQWLRFCRIHYNTFSRRIKISQPGLESGEHCADFKLKMYFELPGYMEFTKKIKFLKFVNVNEVCLYIGKKRNKDIMNFIDFSLPNKTNELYISLSLEMQLNRTTYLNSFIRISSKVTRKAGFNSFCLSLRQLKKLVAAYRHVETLGIYECKLSISTVHDFSTSLKNCKIQTISLGKTGDKSCNNWKDHPDEFKNLIQCFATSSDLKKSLRKIDIWKCGIKQSEANEILAENQLEEVEITGGS